MTTENIETVVAFYGIKPTTRGLAAFYNAALELFEAVEIPPKIASIHGPGHSGKYIAFGKAAARIAKTGFHGVTSININAPKADASYLSSDYVLSTYLRAKDEFLRVSGLTSVVPLSKPVLFPLLAKLMKELAPRYGIGYNMSVARGPSWYAAGVCSSQSVEDAVDRQSGEAYEEGLRISRWGHTYMPARVWEMGLLRDVYSWNFLSAPQLAKPIHKLSLEKWIGQDASRGTLIPVSNGLMFWELAEPQIPGVREALIEADLIIDWDKHRSLVGG